MLLSSSEVLSGYDAVCSLYPYIPPLSHWRAWEYAAYQKFQLDGRVLDIGCGDGQYFQLIWPEAKNVVGVDMEPDVADAGRASGVYTTVHTTEAHQIPELDESFDSVFANCSLEHMDHLALVLKEIFRCLKPGGVLLCSVVTDRFIDWSLLPSLVTVAGHPTAGKNLQEDFVAYHHLSNPLPATEWEDYFTKAGLIPEVHIPILPKVNSGAFLLMDSLCHVKQASGGEFGDFIFPFLSDYRNFPEAFRHILTGLLAMETDWRDCSGAVFLARKPARSI